MTATSSRASSSTSQSRRARLAAAARLGVIHMSEPTRLRRLGVGGVWV